MYQAYVVQLYFKVFEYWNLKMQKQILEIESDEFWN